MSKTALETAIYSTLSGDSGGGGVATLATGGIYNTEAAPRASLPLVLFNVNDDPTVTRFSGDAIDATFSIEVVEDKELGASTLTAIVDRARVLLHNQTLTISGFNGGDVICTNRGQTFTDVDALRNISLYYVHANT